MIITTDILRQRVLNVPFEIFIERAKYWTEPYKETEGLHPIVRAV